MAVALDLIAVRAVNSSALAVIKQGVSQACSLVS